MKKFLLWVMIAILGIVLTAWAAQAAFIVSNPYVASAPQPTYFVIQYYTNNARDVPLGGPIISPAYPLNDGSVIVHHDVSDAVVGTIYYVNVWAVLNDPWAGEVTSPVTPFQYRRNDLTEIIAVGLPAPGGLRLSSQ